MKRFLECHIGDGAYVYLSEDRTIVFYTSDGIRETNRVVIDPDHLGLLDRWFQDMKQGLDLYVTQHVELRERW